MTRAAGTIRRVTTAAATDLDDPYRLPRHTTPTRYDLVLEPDLQQASFRGSVTIAVDTVEIAPDIVLNAIELEIDAVSVDGVEAPYRLDDDTERLTIEPAGGVEPGAHRIDIEFRGILNDQLRGWYRSTYVDADGAERVIATTQMQSTDCRRAFPCFDEPDFKAVFGVTLVVDDDLLAVSNGRRSSAPSPTAAPPYASPTRCA